MNRTKQIDKQQIFMRPPIPRVAVQKNSLVQHRFLRMIMNDYSKIFGLNRSLFYCDYGQFLLTSIKCQVVVLYEKRAKNETILILSDFFRNILVIEENIIHM